jgi:hypothetical protein
MNIEQIYGEQKPYIERQMATSYNQFIRALESDMDYNLADDEASELYSELLLMYMRDTMSYDEWTRVINSIAKK